MALVPGGLLPPARLPRPFEAIPDGETPLHDRWWGASTALSVFLGTLGAAEPAAKQSTRYVARGAIITACNVDRSQRATNMSAGTGCVFEAASSRFNYSHPRTIYVRCQANNTDTEILWTHGSGGTLERIRFSAANTLIIQVAGVTVQTYTFTALGASREDLVIAWVSEANPDTTGASDAVLSHLYIWNVTDGTFDKVAFTHVTKALVSATALFGAGTTAGVQAFSGVISMVGYENRAMSATEIAVTLGLETRTAPSSSAARVSHQGVPPVSSLLIGAAGYKHGPLAAMAVDTTRRMYCRLLSPLWNERMRVATDWTDALLDSATDPWIRGAPDANAWRMHLTYKRAYPVPDNATHLWVRVHLRTWTTSGEAVPLGARLYSMNRPPGWPGEEPFAKYFEQAIVTRDDDSSDGAYELEAVVTLARGTAGDWKDWTVLALALQVDPNAASGNDANARVNVRAVHVVPLFRDQQGGLGFSPGVGS